MREPDWEALAELQFMLYNRIAGALNEAIASLALSDMPEAQDKPPGYWKERATGKIANVLNLFTAWSYLIRYKRGEPLPERALRPFRANDLLRWLATQLQITPAPQAAGNPLLRANQETLQEALLLLYSAACAQGAGVVIQVEGSAVGAWFRVGFVRSKPLAPTLDELLASLGDHWRAQDTAFELRTARDFIALNGGELLLVTSDLHAEFTFFVQGADRRAARPVPSPATTTAAASVAPAPPDETRPLASAPQRLAATQPTLALQPTLRLPEFQAPVLETPALPQQLQFPLPPATIPAGETADAGVTQKAAPAEAGPQEAPAPPGEPARPIAQSERVTAAPPSAVVPPAIKSAPPEATPSDAVSAPALMAQAPAAAGDDSTSLSTAQAPAAATDDQSAPAPAPPETPAPSAPVSG